jgi:hypothetical protein
MVEVGCSGNSLPQHLRCLATRVDHDGGMNADRNGDSDSVVNRFPERDFSEKTGNRCAFLITVLDDLVFFIRHKTSHHHIAGAGSLALLLRRHASRLLLLPAKAVRGTGHGKLSVYCIIPGVDLLSKMMRGTMRMWRQRSMAEPRKQ